jgi:hypothetical protein
MHIEGKTFMLTESQQVLKNRENPLQFLGNMRNERRGQTSREITE